MAPDVLRMGWRRRAFTLLVCVSLVWARDPSTSDLHDDTTTGQGEVNKIDHVQAGFNFSHEVKQPMYGNFYGHTSHREGDRVDGRYYVLLPDRRLMTVSYYADATGYHPTVSYSPIQLTGMFQDFQFGTDAKGGWSSKISENGTSSTASPLLSSLTTKKPEDARPDSSVAASFVVPANGITQSVRPSSSTNLLTLRPAVLTSQLSGRPSGAVAPAGGIASPPTSTVFSTSKQANIGYVYTASTTARPETQPKTMLRPKTALPRMTTLRPTVSTSPSTATTARPLMTSMPPRATTAGPRVTTARTTVTTARPRVTTARTTVTTARPRVTTARPTVTTARSRATTARHTVKTAHPRVTTARTIVTTARPRITTARPRVTTARIRVTTAQPRVTTARPTVTTARPRATTARHTVTTARPRVTTARPRITTARPTVTTARPAVMTVRPTVTIARPRVTSAPSRVKTERTKASTARSKVKTTRPGASPAASPMATTARPLATSAPRQGSSTARPPFGSYLPPVGGLTTASLATSPPPLLLPPPRGGVPIAFPSVTGNRAINTRDKGEDNGISFGRRFNTSIFGRRINSTSSKNRSSVNGNNGNNSVIGNMNTFGYRLGGSKYGGSQGSLTNGIRNSNGSKWNTGNSGGSVSKKINVKANDRNNRNGGPNGSHTNGAINSGITGVGVNNIERNSNSNNTNGKNYNNRTSNNKGTDDQKDNSFPRQSTGNEIAQSAFGNAFSEKDVLFNNGFSFFEFKKISPKSPATKFSSPEGDVATTTRTSDLPGVTTQAPIIEFSTTKSSFTKRPTTKGPIIIPTSTKSSVTTLPRSQPPSERLTSTTTPATLTKEPVTGLKRTNTSIIKFSVTRTPFNQLLTANTPVRQTATAQSVATSLPPTTSRVPTTTAPFFFSRVTSRLPTHVPVRGTSQAPSRSTTEHDYDKEAGPAYIPVPSLTGLVAGAPVPQGRSRQKMSRRPSSQSVSSLKRSANSSAAAATLKPSSVPIRTTELPPFFKFFGKRV